MDTLSAIISPATVSGQVTRGERRTAISVYEKPATELLPTVTRWTGDELGDRCAAQLSGRVTHL